jgi:hypothetical protein
MVNGVIPAKAGNENYPTGARAAAMGQAAVTFTNLWSIHHNQAGLAFIDTWALGVYSENRFNVHNNTKALAGAYHVDPGTMGLQIRHFGYELYSEQKIGFAYARKFGESFATGIQFDYLHTYIAEEYGNAGNITFELGLLGQVVPDLWLGAHVFNPLALKLSNQLEEKIPTSMRFGMAYMVDQKATLAVEAEKTLQYAPVYKAGVEYKLYKSIFARGGISSGITSYQYSFGLGFGLLGAAADVSFVSHEILGFIPHIAITYQFDEE